METFIRDGLVLPRVYQSPKDRIDAKQAMEPLAISLGVGPVVGYNYIDPTKNHFTLTSTANPNMSPIADTNFVSLIGRHTLSQRFSVGQVLNAHITPQGLLVIGPSSIEFTNINVSGINNQSTTGKLIAVKARFNYTEDGQPIIEVPTSTMYTAMDVTSGFTFGNIPGHLATAINQPSLSALLQKLNTVGFTIDPLIEVFIGLYQVGRSVDQTSQIISEPTFRGGFRSLYNRFNTLNIASAAYGGQWPPKMEEFTAVHSSALQEVLDWTRTFHITPSMLDEDLIEESMLRFGSVTTDKIAAEALVEKHFSEKCVPSLAIGDGVIVSRHFSDKCIPSKALSTKSVLTEHLGDNSVTSDKLAGRSITSEKIGSAQVKSEHIDNGQVKNHHLATGSVGTNAIASNCIEEDHMTSQSILLRGKRGQEGPLSEFAVPTMPVLLRMFTSNFNLLVNELYGYTGSMGAVVTYSNDRFIEYIVSNNNPKSKVTGSNGTTVYKNFDNNPYTLLSFGTENLPSPMVLGSTPITPVRHNGRGAPDDTSKPTGYYSTLFNCMKPDSLEDVRFTIIVEVPSVKVIELMGTVETRNPWITTHFKYSLFNNVSTEWAVGPRQLLDKYMIFEIIVPKAHIHQALFQDQVAWSTHKHGLIFDLELHLTP